MLEGLEISVLNLSEVLNDNKTQRIDSEYFKGEYLKIDRSIENKKYLRLSALSEKITDFGAFSQNNFIKYKEKGSFYFIRNQDIENLFIKDKKIFIDKDVYDKLSLKLNEFDLLIQRTGSIGKCGLVLKKDLPSSANQNLAQVKPDKNKINPYFLNTFLNSSIGQKTFERLATGNVQPWLNLGQIESIKIPLLSKKLQISIEDVIKSSYNNISTSKQSYTKAETLLLEEIGLQDFTPSKEPVNIKSFATSFGTSGRLDAEYYQPKYEKIENAIKTYKNGFETLDAFIKNFSTGYPYKSKSYIKKDGIPLIRINNIKKGHLSLDNAIQIPKKDLDLSPKDVAVENDILISMSGTIGNTCKIPKGIKAVVNQRIMKITPQNYNFEVLPLVINSIIGELQLNRIGTGGVQTNISSTDIRKILIPKIVEEKQQQIANLIEESFALKKQSEQLLEVAKKAVEIAIEESEEVALEYISQWCN